MSPLGAARAVLRRLAPHWHPSRLAPVRKAIAAWVTWRRPSTLPTRHGFSLYVPMEDRSPIVVSLFLEREYEPEETRAIQGLLRPGDVAVDIGANVGYMTCLMASRVGPGGAVHAFEPEPRHFEALERNVAANGLGNVFCHRVALSATGGRTSLYLDPENPGDHTLVPLPGRRSVSVETVSFDDYWRTTGESRPIRLLKLDVQGHETGVVRGMADSLRTGRIDAILVEVWPYRLEQAGSSAEELLGSLLARDRRVEVLSTTAPERPETLSELRSLIRVAAGDVHLAFNLLLTDPGRFARP